MNESTQMDGSARADGSGLVFGPVAAVFVAAGIGAVVLGILTTLSEASDSIASALEWSKSVGPLTGKVLISSAAFFLAWGVLAAMWKKKDPDKKKIWTTVVILFAAGFVLTFPLFFQLFSSD